ncbi:MAG: pilin [Patescibacteria group bacterium]
MKQIHLLRIATLAASAFALPSRVLAVDPPFTKGLTLVNTVGSSAGITTSKGLPEIIGSIINVALGFLGIVFLVLLLYAGFLWMTAQGEPKTVDKAKDMLKQAIIGLIIIVAAFAVSNFVLTSLVNVTAP